MEIFGLQYLCKLIIILINIASLFSNCDCKVYFEPVFFYITGHEKQAEGFYSTDGEYLYKKIKYLEKNYKDLELYVGRYFKNEDSCSINVAAFRNFDTLKFIKKDSVLRKLIPIRDTTSISEYTNSENEISNIFYEMRQEGADWNSILVYKTYKHEEGHCEDDVLSLRKTKEEKENEANRRMIEGIKRDWKIYKLFKNFMIK